jgi:hypothetical protein
MGERASEGLQTQRFATPHARTGSRRLEDNSLKRLDSSLSNRRLSRDACYLRRALDSRLGRLPADAIYEVE